MFVCNSIENQLEDENFSSSSSKSENIIVKKRIFRFCGWFVGRSIGTHDSVPNPDLLESNLF